jgi:hypothetical protein
MNRRLLDARWAHPWSLVDGRLLNAWWLTRWNVERLPARADGIATFAMVEHAVFF